MNRSETADLLAFCAGFDKRKIGASDVNAWALVLAAVDEEDAREAVIMFYRDTHVDDRGRDRPVGTGDIMAYLRVRDAKKPPPQLPAPSHPEPDVAISGRQQVLAAQVAGHGANVARRDRVLRYPDLAVRLTQEPLCYPRAGMWNGFVPPKDDQDAVREQLHSPGGWPNRDRKHTVGRGVNDSPRRVALVNICSEALEREKQEQAEDW